MRRVGMLLSATVDYALYQAWAGAFVQELARLDWLIGRNVLIETRWATADPEANRRQAAELVALAPDVIFSGGASTVGPLLQVTRAVRNRLHCSAGVFIFAITLTLRPRGPT